MLTDKEKQIIERAFVMVNRRNQYSCMAIEYALGRSLLGPFHKLTRKYGRFFKQVSDTGWDWNGLTFRQRKQARLMLLATFWELG